MAIISPANAANAAARIYKLGKRGAKLSHFKSPFKGAFTFDDSARFDGVTGGHIFNSKRGFGVIGVGASPGPFAGDHVIIFRGTDGNGDLGSDAQFGLTLSSNNQFVHSGFQNTFDSLKPALEAYFSKVTKPGTIHCIGHSLGGAIATLATDWVVANTVHSVNLYTFGSPRVGLAAFATNQTGNPKIKNIFRATHGGDPISMVPIWPFTHVPNDGTEYRLNSSNAISMNAHYMDANNGGVPGYVQSVSSAKTWGALRGGKNFIPAANSAEFLTYETRHRTTFSQFGIDSISAGLVAILKEAGYYALVATQAVLGTGITFYDFLAKTMKKIADASIAMASKVKGLLGHMLSFIGDVVTAIADVTFALIKMVFQKVLSKLYSLANRTLGGVS